MNLNGIRRLAAAAKENLYEDATRADGGRHAPKMAKFLPLLIIIFSIAIIGAWLLFVGFARLVGFNVLPWWPALGSLPPKHLFDVTRAAATAAGVLAGVFAIVYAYRKQQVEEAGGHRQDSEQLSQRYQDAAEELGHPRAAVRLAGVYAMSRLADDWLDQRQQCVDVLCAYLRLPLDLNQEVAEEDEVVRRAIMSEINLHTWTGRSDGKSWSNLRIDFSKVHFKEAEFFNNTFYILMMERARVDESLSFGEMVVTEHLNMSNLDVRGRLSLSAARAGESLYMSRLHISPGAEVHIFRSLRSTEDVRYRLEGAQIATGGVLRISLPPGSKSDTYDLSRVEVAGELRIRGSGRSCESGAIATYGLVTSGLGYVEVEAEMLDAKTIVELSPDINVKRSSDSGWP